MKPDFNRGQKVRVYNPKGPICAVVLDIEYIDGGFIYLLKEDGTDREFRDAERWIHNRHPYDMWLVKKRSKKTLI